MHGHDESSQLPLVWVFPEVLVCLDCGVAVFAVPETELGALAYCERPRPSSGKSRPLDHRNRTPSARESRDNRKYGDMGGRGAALVVPTGRIIGNEDMPRQRLANGWYEFSHHPGLHRT